jgi:hypothetical protein
VPDEPRTREAKAESLPEPTEADLNASWLAAKRAQEEVHQEGKKATPLKGAVTWFARHAEGKGGKSAKGGWGYVDSAEVPVCRRKKFCNRVT